MASVRTNIATVLGHATADKRRVHTLEMRWRAEWYASESYASLSAKGRRRCNRYVNKHGLNNACYRLLHGDRVPSGLPRRFVRKLIEFMRAHGAVDE